MSLPPPSSAAITTASSRTSSNGRLDQLAERFPCRLDEGARHPSASSAASSATATSPSPVQDGRLERVGETAAGGRDVTRCPLAHSAYHTRPRSLRPLR